MRSFIEDHPQRVQIERSIIAGKSSRAIAATCSPPVSHSAINDYRKKALAHAVGKQAKAVVKQAINLARESGENVSTELIRETTSRQTLAAPFIATLERKYARYERWMQGAESKDDFKALASLDTAETRAIQLQAQLAGALQQDQQTTTQINVALVMPSTSQADRPALASGTTIDVEPCE